MVKFTLPQRSLPDVLNDMEVQELCDDVTQNIETLQSGVIAAIVLTMIILTVVLLITQICKKS